ncbi:NERD domain-containing protein [Burkholderia gladioli]|uniref:NERD domain-containing protein n=1 Tax=Burkholderia gladioli TaxID=28095 RepID=UPI0016405D85|nr:NERD domain-containing protein [Burkholderia gladioli]MBU9384033.1 hypothetical protein [Burkholderia gladioli]
MTIEVYCGDPEAPRNATEHRLLAQIVSILQGRCESAIVLINVRCNEHECDVLVSTPVTALVIEVKHYLQPVGKHSISTVASVDDDGESRCYRMGTT